jgi:hypothetical protein
MTMTDRLLTNMRINTALILFTLVLTSMILGLLFGRDINRLRRPGCGRGGSAGGRGGFG